jgi:uncharacterized protein (TIRG00374 family)
LQPRLIFGVTLLLGTGLFAYVIRSHGLDALAVLRDAPSLPLLLTFFASVFATVLCLSWRWGMILAGISRVPRLSLLFLFRSAAHCLAVLVPSGKVGGDPLRVWFAVRKRTAPGDAIASVAVDRTLEIGSTAPFSVIFATLLLQAGVPQLGHALVTVVIAMIGIAVGIALAVRRLRSGGGLIAALVRNTRLDRLAAVQARMEIIESADHSAAALTRQHSRMAVAFAAGLLSNLLVILEFWLLLTAFDLPNTPIAVVAAIFATGAAHMTPVPAGIGVIEGSQMWMFEMLGYPPDVGLAVGLAVRLREIVWMLPGLLYVAVISLGAFGLQTRADAH